MNTPLEETRIELVFADDRRVPISVGRSSYASMRDAFGALRIFLRKHGWLPEDERERVSR